MMVLNCFKALQRVVDIIEAFVMVNLHQKSKQKNSVLSMADVLLPKLPPPHEEGRLQAPAHRTM